MNRKWVTLAVVTGAHACSAFSGLSVAPLSPFLLDALRMSRSQVGLLLPALYLGGVVMSLPAGWLVDRLGVRLTLVLGLGLTGVMVGVAAMTHGLAALLACLCVGGFGWSVLNPASGKAIVEAFPPRQRGMAMGIKQTGLTLGGVGASIALPPIALALGWRDALLVAAAASLACVAVVAIGLGKQTTGAVGATATQPRVTDLGQFFRRPGLVVLFVGGFLLSVVQASVLSYLVLYAKEALGYSVVAAAGLLALAQAGGTASRLAWGVLSDWLFGGRRRPGLVINALIGATSYTAFALSLVPPVLAPVLAVVAGAAAFGYMGLYLALVAEIGGARYAGLLTGVAVSFAWSGVLVGPPLFGLVLEATGSYALPWGLLTVVAIGVAAALHRLRPLVQRVPATPTAAAVGLTPSGVRE